MLVLELASRCDPPFPQEEALKKVESAWMYQPRDAMAEAVNTETSGTKDPLWTQGHTAEDILQMNISAPKIVIENVLMEGVTMLAGKLKRGKSWQALSLAIAVASVAGKASGAWHATHGDVLYLALEDSYRRLKSRIEQLLAQDPAPRRLLAHVDWPTIEQGGIEELEAWLQVHPDAKLVVVDTWQRFRGVTKRRSNGNAYTEDYDALGKVKHLADQYGVSILLSSGFQDFDEP
jgi:hypothetical protein